MFAQGLGVREGYTLSHGTQVGRRFRHDSAVFGHVHGVLHMIMDLKLPIQLKPLIVI